MTIEDHPSGQTETIEMPFQGNGFNYEAEAFGELLRTGGKESPVMTLSESLEIMRVMDEIRECWGLKYPGE